MILRSINCIFLGHRPRPEFQTDLPLSALRLAAVATKCSGAAARTYSVHPHASARSIARELTSTTVDVVGISAYSWTVHHVLEIVSELHRSGFPGIVIVGGPATYGIIDREAWPENTVLVHGDGEDAVRTIIRARQSEVDATVVHNQLGIDSNREADRPRVCYPTSPNCEPVDFTRVASPQFPFVWWETSRGCPYTCSFCDHRRTPVRNLDDRVVELEASALGRSEARSMFIVDPNVGGTPARGKWLWSLLREQAPDVRVRAFIRPEFLDEEYIDILAQISIEELQIGIQTLNPNVNTGIRNNSIGRLTRVLPLLSERRVPWRAELIVGLPGDTMDGLQSSVHFVMNQLRPSSVYAYPLSVLPNTPLALLPNDPAPEGWVRRDLYSLRAISSHSYNEGQLRQMASWGTVACAVYNTRRAHSVPHQEHHEFDVVSSILDRIQNSSSQEEQEAYMASDRSRAEVAVLRSGFTASQV